MRFYPKSGVAVVLLLAASAAAAPHLLSTPASHDFGQVPLGTWATTTLTLSNDGDAPVDISAFTLTGANATDFSLPGGPTPPTQIAAGSSLQLSVTFAPGNHLARAADLVLQSNKDPPGALTIPLAGSGIGPRCVVSPTSLAFGSVDVGAPPLTKQLQIANQGETDLTVKSVAFSGSAGADYSSATSLPITLAPAQSSSIDVRFQPGGPGARNARATVTSDDPLLAKSEVALEGVGVSPAIALTPLVLDCGEVRVGQNATKVLSVSNTGNSPLTLSGATVGGTDAASFGLGPTSFPQTLQPGGATQLPLTFAPTALGVAGAQLTVSSDDPKQGSAQSILVGNGTSPTLSLSARKLDFGPQLVGRTSLPRTLEIRNLGSSALSVSALTLGGASASSFAVLSAPVPFSIAPGEQGAVKVTLRPEVEGGQLARLTVSSDDGSAPQAQVELAGLGVSAALSVSPTTLDFGTLRVAMSSSPSTVTVTNASGDTLQLLNATLSGSHASSFVAGTQAGWLGPGASTTASVVFQPVAGGAASAQLSFRTADSRQALAVVNLVGQSLAQVIEAAPPSLDFGPVELGKTSPPQKLLLTNLASQPLGARLEVGDDQFLLSEVSVEIPAGGVASLEISFAPRDQLPVDARLEVILEGRRTPELSVALSGSGIRKGGRGCGCSGAAQSPLLLLGLLATLRFTRSGRAERGGR